VTANAKTARDGTLLLATNAVLAFAPNAKIFYDGKLYTTAQQPKQTDSWVRFSFQHFTGRQASLAGLDGARRWNRTGLLTAQCFAPLVDGDAVNQATKLASLVRDGLQGKQTDKCVWFRNLRIAEIGVDKDWYNVNSYATFDYDEITDGLPYDDSDVEPCGDPIDGGTFN
jgi:hypothetical protein